MVDFFLYVVWFIDFCVGGSYFIFKLLMFYFSFKESEMVFLNEIFNMNVLYLYIYIGIWVNG